MQRSIETGLVVLQGNRLEMLRDVVFRWIADHPLDPLEEEVFLVQSNRAAEWLKIGLASSQGVCAATRVELPGRFLWRLYRRVLGRDRVPAQSALDRDALTWRLMRLFPTLVGGAAFASVARFLADGDPVRRLQLARRLADLYDQYQVYRADWLVAWEHGRATLPTPDGREPPLPAEERWQADLWRALLDELSPAERAATRPRVHRAFVDALAAGRPAADGLPPRVILFGASHVPTQTLEALASVSSTMQVLLAVPNPCRFHWADIIDGAEALRQTYRRLPPKPGPDLSTVPFDAMHLHANPLLAAWGRQGRDFMRALDAFDDTAARQRLAIAQVASFDEGNDGPLLRQVQARIRDLVPAGDLPRAAIPASDRSIVFHVAHGPAREVEILHDQLLATLAAADGALAPRDVVVMVPDIDAFAPSIRAVFGQHAAGDARRIPFDIADLRSRAADPLIVGLEWLLRVPDERVRLQDVRDLLEIPAVAARFAIDAEALPTLFEWLAAAGVRWGIDADHRTRLGLGATGEQNSWLFGIRRLLLGYASGDASGYAGVEPYPDIGGIDAAVVGPLIELLERIDRWRVASSTDATPAAWADRARALLAALFEPVEQRERLTLAALQGALSSWLADCDAAAFVEPVPLAVLRDGWLSGIDDLDASRRFTSGGVTFCTLMPLRSVPFEIVCLLGMNDGAFPRPARTDDFDLMSRPGHRRAGDRSRRDDDRYLMLEALLSARRTLYIGWSGFSARDNASEPPSVLVAQLRDYLASDWSGEAGPDVARSVLADRTTEHPLQPFSRRYFDDSGLVTYAREWGVAHDDEPRTTSRPAPVPASASASADAADRALTLADLGAFLRNPVKVFFRERLQVRVPDEPEAVGDDETFVLEGLGEHALKESLTADAATLEKVGIEAAVRERLRRVQGSGALPLFGIGVRVGAEVGKVVTGMSARWMEALAAAPHVRAKRPVRVDEGAMPVDDWIDGLRSDGERDVRIAVSVSRMLDKQDGTLRVDRLVVPWVTMLAATAHAAPFVTVMVGCDATVTIDPLVREEAAALFGDLLSAWVEGSREPLPVAAKTALAYVVGGASARAATTAYEGSKDRGGEVRDFALGRQYASFDELVAAGFASWAERLYAPIAAWAATARIETHDAFDAVASAERTAA